MALPTIDEAAMDSCSVNWFISFFKGFEKTRYLIVSSRIGSIVIDQSNHWQAFSKLERLPKLHKIRYLVLKD